VCVCVCACMELLIDDSRLHVQYLSYVRASDRYESQTIMSTLEYRDDTPDALEVSVCL
jgi:hypothetical protein